MKGLMFVLATLSWVVSFGQEVKLGLPVGHTENVNSAEFSPDGKLIVTSSDDKTVKVWDVQTGALISNLQHESSVKTAYFNSDCSAILTASDDGVLLWNVEDGKYKVLTNDGSFFNMAYYDPSYEFTLTLESNTYIEIYDIRKSKLIREIGDGDLVFNSVDISHDGRFILTECGIDGIMLWDFKSGKLINSSPELSTSIRTSKIAPNDSSVLIVSNEGNAIILDIDLEKIIRTIDHARIESAVFSPSGNEVLCNVNGHRAELIDLELNKVIRSFEPVESNIKNVSFSKDGRKISTSHWDGSVIIWDAETGNKISELRSKVAAPNNVVTLGSNEILVTFDDSRYLATYESTTGKLVYSEASRNQGIDRAFLRAENLNLLTDKDFSLKERMDLFIGELKRTLIENQGRINLILLSPNKRFVFTSFSTRNPVIWDLETGEMIHSLIGHKETVNKAQFSSDSKKILTTSSKDAYMGIWDTQSGNLQKLVKTDNTRYPRLFEVSFINNDSSIVTKTTAGIKVWNTESFESTKLKITENEFDRKFGNAQTINYQENRSYEVHAQKDRSVVLMNTETGEQIIRHFIFDSDPNKWVHLHPSGLFDASAEAMELMYWTKGLEIIEFTQLKDRYWVPGLWEKVMKGETLPDVRGMNELKLQPEVQLGQVVDGKLPITLIKRDGGYGAVSISINGKEVISDARGNDIDTAKQVQTIYYSIKDHPYLQNGENEISVKASSADGFVTGRGEGFKYLMEKKEAEKPNFYALVIGVSDYVNDAIDLKYPEKDAKALAEAVKLGAGKLFGTEKSEVYTLTASEGKRPNKETIQAAFKQVASKAKAQDVLMVYLSGHGVTWGGDQGDFYFLTADATAAHKDAYNDPAIRSTATISSSEMVEWIKEIPALKQVMIIDACGSGKAVDNLIAARDVESSQIKAIDRMKDRTGMFVISGCAADAVSYEASQYGQGLLTYAILQAMKGAALKEDKYVDVFTILQHARESVPKLAAGLGGIQEPQFLHPKGGSFDIGILEQEDKAKIALAEPKRVFVRSVLVEKSKYRDVLGLSTLLNNSLSDQSSRGTDAQLVFFDAEEYGNSCQLTGGYKELDGIIELDLNIVCNGSEMTHQLKASSSTELVEQIIELVNK